MRSSWASFDAKTRASHKSASDQLYTDVSVRYLLHLMCRGALAGLQCQRISAMEIAGKALVLALLCALAAHGAVEAGRMGPIRKLTQVPGGMGRVLSLCLVITTQHVLSLTTSRNPCGLLEAFKMAL